jgi:hypothetical protein
MDEPMIKKNENDLSPFQKVLQMKTTNGDIIKVLISRISKLEISEGTTKIYLKTYER